jgi:hypothetical protein
MGTASTIDPVWFKAVSDAIGIPDMLKYYQGIDLGVTFSGTAYDEFKTNLLASAAQFAAAPMYVERGSTLHLYDGIMMMALAMDETHSTDPTVFNAKIKDIGNGVSGSVLVHTYKEGVDAINSGKTVRWAGAGGLTQFNQWNNSQQGYIIVKYDAQGNEVKIGELTFDILHCPGHSPGSVVFFNKDMRFADVGDVLFSGSVGRSDIPGGNHATLIKSITDKLLPLGDDVGFICGHGPGSSIGQERMTNPFLTGAM